MELITIIVSGKIQAKQRARVSRKFAYTPAETVNYERYIQWLYTQMTKHFFDSAVKLDVYCFLTPPQSSSAKKRKAMLNHEIKPTKKPDWDNVGKIVSDSLNKLAYHDDSQVTCGKSMKRYAEKECLIITLQADNEVIPENIHQELNKLIDSE